MLRDVHFRMLRSLKWNHECFRSVAAGYFLKICRCESDQERTLRGASKKGVFWNRYQGPRRWRRARAYGRPRWPVWRTKRARQSFPPAQGSWRALAARGQEPRHGCHMGQSSLSMGEGWVRVSESCMSSDCHGARKCAKLRAAGNDESRKYPQKCAGNTLWPVRWRPKTEQSGGSALYLRQTSPL